MGGTHASDFVSTADDMLEMSGVRGVGGVCEMCLAWSGVGGVGERIALDFTHQRCLCFC